MKTIGITLIAISIMAAFACNNEESEIVDANFSAIGKSISEGSVINISDQTLQNEPNSLEYIVTEILTTSPRFKQLTKGLYKEAVKNGDVSYGISLEGSPNPKQDKACSYSRNYDFRLYESRADKQLNTATFSFNPNDKQLYEYDEVHKQVKQIEFDRNLLLKFETLCK